MKFTRDQVIDMAREAAQEHGHTIKATDEIVETLMSLCTLAANKALEAEADEQRKLGDERRRLGEQWRAWQRLKRPNRSWKAVERIRAALKRISRDKWLSPDEIRGMALHMARLCSSNPTWTASHAIPMECEAIGMLKGEPPAWRWEDDYKTYFSALHGLNRDSGAKAELIILNLTIKRLSNGHKPNHNLR